MVIHTAILKEKNIVIHQFFPAPKMQIKMDRNNLMPKAPINDNIQCELKLKIAIVDEKSKELAVLNLNYIIIATIDDVDNYEQNNCADRLIKALHPMYITEANSLLRESPFPPIPLNVKC